MTTDEFSLGFLAGGTFRIWKAFISSLGMGLSNLSKLYLNLLTKYKILGHKGYPMCKGRGNVAIIHELNKEILYCLLKTKNCL